ncbi:MAG: DUF2461 domain-containing protein [Thermoanaerobaculia bacterium]
MVTPRKNTRHFRPNLFKFLRDLESNNNRDWFKANKSRYEDHVKEPALQFISDFGLFLRQVSPHFRADPRSNGGSLFRIYRDVRFSKDKRPYKTHTGIQFRHENCRDAHAPGFYLHLENGQVFAAAGIWHPDSASLRRIRDAIVSDPARWKRINRAKRFCERYELSGDRLVRPPKGYDPDHPLIEHLKYKDFIGVARLTQKDVTGDGFIQRYAKLSRRGAPLVKFLCEAVGVPF